MRKVLLGVLIGLTVLFLGVNYVHVSGVEIEGGKTLDEHCHVTVTWQEPETGTGRMAELTGDQAAAFGKLLCGSHFFRTFPWQEIQPQQGQICYHIQVDFPGDAGLLEIDSIDNSYIRFAGQYADHYLNIWSGDWETGLDALVGRSSEA